MKKRHQQKLVVLSMVLLLALNMPLLLLFDRSESFLGLPNICVYIFSLWFFSVGITFLIVKRYYE